MHGCPSIRLSKHTGGTPTHVGTSWSLRGRKKVFCPSRNASPRVRKCIHKCLFCCRCRGWWKVKPLRSVKKILLRERAVMKKKTTSTLRNELATKRPREIEVKRAHVEKRSNNYFMLCQARRKHCELKCSNTNSFHTGHCSNSEYRNFCYDCLWQRGNGRKRARVCFKSEM